MGTSSPRYLSEMANFIKTLQPKKILDIGIGFGKNGYLCREYTDIWNKNYTKETWKTTIHGIEIYENYLHDGHRFVYDKIFVGDCYEVLNTLGNYDLIIATDVLEHLEKQRSIEVMRIINEKSNNFYFTIPLDPGTRGGHSSNGAGYNKWEAHISGIFNEKDFPYGKAEKINNFWRIYK